MALPSAELKPGRAQIKSMASGSVVDGTYERDKVHAHRFRHTFATWAIAHDARELDVQYLLGHSSPDMVRRYSSSYRSEQAAMRHHAFSPGDQMLSADLD